MEFSKDFPSNSDDLFMRSLADAQKAIQTAATINCARLCSEEDRARLNLTGTVGFASTSFSDEEVQTMWEIVTEAVERMSGVMAETYGLSSLLSDEGGDE